MLARPDILPIKSFMAFVARDGARWEAVCLDFDLAAQGRSQDEVIGKLREQVALFLDGVAALPAADQARLLRRKVPLWLRIRWLSSVARSVLLGHPVGGPSAYPVPLRADFVAA
jgi:hypothetical protein